MITTITVIHLLVCIVLILVVLLQTGKGSEMGAVFGGSSQTVFGSTGAAPFLSKLTTGVAIVFMLTSLVLATLGARPESSLMDDEPAAPLSIPPAAVPETPLPAEQNAPQTQVPRPQAAPATGTIPGQRQTQPPEQANPASAAAPSAEQQLPASSH